MKYKKETIVNSWFVTLVVAVLLGVLIIFTYGGLKNTFFQQDEWASIGFVRGAHSVLGELPMLSLIQVAAGNQRILGSLINNIFHFYMPFNIWPFVLFSIMFHWANALLVFVFVKRLTKNYLLGFTAAGIFSLLYTPSEALVWFSSHTTALPNCFFVLLALHSYLSYLENSNARYKIAAYVSFIVSLLFKESSIFLFFIFPLMDMFFVKRKISVAKIALRHAVLLGYGLFIIAARAVNLITVQAHVGVFSTGQPNYPVNIVIHALSYPVTSFSQLFIPNKILFKLAPFFQTAMYEFITSHPLRTAINTIMVSDMLSVYFTCLFLITGGIVLYVEKGVRGRLIFAYQFTFLSFLPFAVVDRPLSSYLESRYYYLGSIGAAMIIAFIIEALYLRIKTRSTPVVFIGVIFITVIFASYIYKNTVFIKRDINEKIITANERKVFLTDLKNKSSILPEKPIFYIEGDSPGFYGLSDLAVPFQQGMGYTIMVWFFDTGKIPGSFLSSSFLWNINAQGYKEDKEKGFGYYWNRDALKHLFAQRPDISPGQVVGFRYVASQKKLIDITGEIRNDIVL